MSLSEYFEEKKSIVKGLATAGTLSALLSGCAHLAGMEHEQYNVCMDPKKFDEIFGGDKNFGQTLVEFPVMAAAGSCYAIQEIVRFPIMIGGLLECGVRNTIHSDSPEEKEALPPFCDFK
jgi:hypothetical protein